MPTPSKTTERTGGVLAGLRRLAAEPGSHLLPLRGFLGVTFVFAGLQKLANPAFFRASSPTSIQQQLTDAHTTSPVHALVGIALHAPVLFGVLIALAELAVGLGTLAGLLSRVAAGGGMALSLTFFLTVSFHTSPYYYGADIVFFFAWTGIVLHGATTPSLDRYLAERHAARAAAGAGGGAGAAAHRVGSRGDRQRDVAEIDRRAAMRKGVLAGTGAALTLALGGVDAAVGRSLAPAPGSSASPGRGLSGGSGGGGGTVATTTTAPAGGGTTGTSGGDSSTTPTTTASGTPKGSKIGLASAVTVGGAASFTDPASGNPAYVVQPSAGDYAGFSAICTHEGCTVNFVQSSETFNCPCHGSIYNARTGAVIQGPAPSPLPSIPIALGPGGELYADG